MKLENMSQSYHLCSVMRQRNVFPRLVHNEKLGCGKSMHTKCTFIVSPNAVRLALIVRICTFWASTIQTPRCLERIRSSKLLALSRYCHFLATLIFWNWRETLRAVQNSMLAGSWTTFKYAKFNLQLTLFDQSNWVEYIESVIYAPIFLDQLAVPTDVWRAFPFATTAR